MLIIAIGFDAGFSCSSFTDSVKVNHLDMESVLNFIVQDKNLNETDIDELIVVENDDVIASYRNINEKYP